MDGNAYQQGDHMTVLGNTGSLVKTGYTFNNWNTAFGREWDPLRPADSFNMPGPNVTLYAQWSSASTWYVYSDGVCESNTPCHRTVREALEATGTKTLILIAAEQQDGDFSLNADKSLTLQGGLDRRFSTIRMAQRP